MENITNSDSDKNSIVLANDGIIHLKAIAKWTKLLSIAGFTFIGLMLILVLIIGINAGMISSSKLSFISLIPLLLISAIYFFPIFYLFQFSRYSKQAIFSKDEGLLSVALNYLKMHYQFMGILLITILCLYLFVGIGFLLSGKLLKLT